MWAAARVCLATEMIQDEFLFFFWRPQCLPVEFQSHGLVWRARSDALPVAEHALRLKLPHSADLWEKLALASCLHRFRPPFLWKCEDARNTQVQKIPFARGARSAASAEGVQAVQALLNNLEPGPQPDADRSPQRGQTFCCNLPGLSPEALDAWTWALLKPKKTKTRKDRTLSDVLNFIQEFDKAAYEEIDEDMKKEVEAAKIPRKTQEPDAHAKRTRQNATPAEYRATCWHVVFFIV